MPFPRAAIGAYLTILGGSAGRLLVSLVYFLIVANTLTLGEFGLFATASATGLILSRLLAFGFVSPLYRVATVKPRLLGAYLAGFAALGLASLPVIATVAAAVYLVLFADRMAAAAFALVILAEVIGWRVVEVVAIVNNGLRRFGRSAALVVTGSSLRTLAALAFWFLPQPDLFAWSAAYLAATAATAVLALLAFLPRVRWRFRRALYPRRMADAVSASAADILFYLQSELDKLLVLALAGNSAAGLYAIVMRIVDLTAMPVRSFNQMLVQRIMQRRSFGGGPALRAGVEAGIAAISVLGLLAVVVLLWIAPLALGRNVASAAPLFLPILLVPAFRNLIEYHAELLYARERAAARLVLLLGVGALKTGLMAAIIAHSPEPQAWMGWLDAVFGGCYLLSALIAYSMLERHPRAG